MPIKKEISQIKTPSDMVAYCHEMFSTQITALNGLLDKVPDGLKTEYLAMRDKMNALLEKLQPLDQVPAAQDAAWALNSFARTITDLFEYIGVMRERMGQTLTSLAEKTTALNGLEEKVTKGELVDKTAAATAAQVAADAAIKPYAAEIGTMRKSQIALCKLPEAPDAILALPLERFNAAVEQAKTNLGTLGQRGFAVGGKGDAFVKQTAWMDQTAFQGANQTLTDLADTLKVKMPAGTEPFAGGTGAAGGAAASAAAGDKPKFRIA